MKGQSVMSTEFNSPEETQLVWGADATQDLIAYVNVFAAQRTPDGYILTLGHSNQPLFNGVPRKS